MTRRHIPSGDLITYDELKHRWPGILDKELVSLIKNKEIAAFTLEKNQIFENNRPTSTCTPCVSPRVSHDKKLLRNIWKDIVFSKENLEQLEFINPDFLINILEDEVKFTAEQDKLEAEVEALHTRPKVTCDIKIEATNDQNQAIPIESLAKTLSAKIAYLEAENARLNTEISRLNAPSSGPLLHLENAKSMNTATRWQGHLRTGLRLALHVLAENRPFTSDELRKVCSKLDCPALAEEALKIFRDTMPPDLINTGGRPPKKKPQDN